MNNIETFYPVSPLQQGLIFNNLLDRAPALTSFNSVLFCRENLIAMLLSALGSGLFSVSRFFGRVLPARCEGVCSSRT